MILTHEKMEMNPPEPPPPSPPDDPDVAAINCYHAGERRKGMQLFDRHVRSVRRYFLNKVRQDADIDDLVNEVFSIMFSPQSGIRTARCFAAYLFGIQRNVLRVYYRLPTVDAALGSSVADLGAGNSTWIERQERCQQLLVGLRRLPIAQQEVLELHYWEEMAAPRAAAVLEVAVGTVASRLRLAKKALLASMGLQAASDAEEVVLLALDEWAHDIAVRLRGGRVSA